MLDLDRPVAVDATPDTLVYADTDDPRRFYAFAARPRLARPVTGLPALSLLAFRSSPTAVLGGAQITATLSLGITDAERQRIAAALDPGPAAAGSPPAAPPVITTPSWRTSVVTLHVAEGVDLTGHGSLDGANDCVLVGQLTGTAASAVQAAIDAGLPDARAQYSVDIDGAHRMAGSASRLERGPASVSGVMVRVASTRADVLHLDLAGPIRLASPDREGIATIVDL